MVSFLENPGFLLAGCTSLGSCSIMPTDVWWLVLDKDSASPIEHEQARENGWP